MPNRKTIQFQALNNMRINENMCNSTILHQCQGQGGWSLVTVILEACVRFSHTNTTRVARWADCYLLSASAAHSAAGHQESSTKTSWGFGMGLMQSGWNLNSKACPFRTGQNLNSDLAEHLKWHPRRRRRLISRKHLT